MAKKLIKKNLLKTLFGLIGIIITMTGWGISNTERFEFLNKIITPKNNTARETWRNMTNNNFVLRQGDKGFSEMKDLFNHGRKTLSPVENQQLPEEMLQIKNLDNWDITQFKTLNSWIGVSKAKPHPVKVITLEIQSSNFRTIIIPQLHSLDEAIESLYLKTPIFKAGAYIFWFGIAISFMSLFMKSRNGK